MNTLNKFEKIVLKIATRIVGFLVSHEKKLVVVSSAAIPAVLKPRYIHKVISLVICFCALALPSVNIYIFVAVSVSFWFYTQFDNSGNKLVAISVCIVFIFINLEIDILDEVLEKHGTANIPTKPSRIVTTTGNPTGV